MEGLAGLPLPRLDGVTSRRTRVDGLRIHYAEAGRGDAIVLVHGWPQHWWSWRHLIGPLARRHRVICPDVRGLGWSEGGEDYSLGRLGYDVVELLDALGIERAALVGHDWGTAIGYQACLSQPGRFTQFVALGGVHPWAANGSEMRLFLRPWHIPLMALCGRISPKVGLAEHCLRSWRYDGRFTGEEMRIYSQAVRRPMSAAATARFYRNLTFHEVPRFARRSGQMRLRVPTLHLNGVEDPLTKGLSHSYRAYADEMRLELIPECGHFLAEERPDLLLEAMTGFLE